MPSALEKIIEEYTQVSIIKLWKSVICYGFSVAEPLPLKDNEDGTFVAELKFISRSKISKTGKEAKEHLRIDVPRNRKIHTVVEKDSEGKWQLVHDEDVIQQKKKKQQSKKSHDK